jgi:hypothetical protein
MSFEKSPKLDDAREIIPDAIKPVTPQQKITRVMAVVLAVLVLILGMMDLWQSNISLSLRGMGIVRGVAMDAQGHPFVGNIFVEGTSLSVNTNADGTFELRNVPAGQRLIVVADNLSGREFPAVINAGETTDIGKITFQTTATP